MLSSCNKLLGLVAAAALAAGCSSSQGAKPPPSATSPRTPQSTAALEQPPLSAFTTAPTFAATTAPATQIPSQPRTPSTGLLIYSSTGSIAGFMLWNESGSLGSIGNGPLGPFYWGDFDPGLTRMAALGGTRVAQRTCPGCADTYDTVGYRIYGTEKGDQFVAVSEHTTGFGVQQLYHDASYLGGRLVGTTTDQKLVFVDTGEAVPDYPTPVPDVRITPSGYGTVAFGEMWSCFVDPIRPGGKICPPAQGQGTALQLSGPEEKTAGSFGSGQTGATMVAVTADGSAFTVVKGRLNFNARGGATTTLTPETDQTINGAALTPDKRTVYFTAQRPGGPVQLYAVPASGGTPDLQHTFNPGFPAQVLKWIAAPPPSS